VKAGLGENLEVSSTLRLWQYRNRKLAGIPPADRVALMIYNMTPPERYSNSSNSIFDIDIAKQFIKPDDEPYPHPLDVAIPAFRWGVLFRGGKYIGLIKSNEVELLVETITPKDEQHPTTYPDEVITIEKDIRVCGWILLKGDEVRPEGIHEGNLFDAQKIGRSLIKDPNQRLIYFSLQPDLLETYGVDKLKRGYE
jgi:hypothetical protein